MEDQVRKMAALPSQYNSEAADCEAPNMTKADERNYFLDVGLSELR